MELPNSIPYRRRILAGKQCDVEEQLTGGCGGRDQNILLTFCFKTG